MYSDIFDSLARSSRPVLIFGAGVRSAHAEAEELVKTLGIPVCVTWGARDMFPEAQGFGTHGTRAANFTVQNADFLLTVGARLDTKATGTPPHWFARDAEKWVVDIDGAELAKFALLKIRAHTIKASARDFLAAFSARAAKHPCDDWKARVSAWRAMFPVDEYRGPGINPYDVVSELSEILQPEEVITSDTGCALAWMMQAFRFKPGQRFLHPFNQTPMGYGLPAAIGAHYATGKRVVCITGDGSFQMSIAELATARSLPIKIVLFNNKGHAMCRQTQRQWFEGRYEATSAEGGLPMPCFDAIAEAYGIRAYRATDTRGMKGMLKAMFLEDEDMETGRQYAADGPALLELDIHPDAEVVPQVKFGRPNEDGTPLLEREVFRQQMIVEPVDA